jgi:hypothetical protein
MKRIWIPQLTASLMLVWALYLENPYAYYILLRWCAAEFLPTWPSERIGKDIRDGCGCWESRLQYITQ